MRILTYASPFEINKNKVLWDMVKQHPHFCASDTLVQGLEAEYGRDSFRILRTVASLINKVFKDYIDNSKNDIQIFLSVSNIIRNMSDSEMKSALRFNIADVVESIKVLAILQCDVNKFDMSVLSNEQKVILDIFKIMQSDISMDIFKNLTNISKNDVIYAIKETINDEIEYICNRNPEYISELNIHIPIKNLKDGYDAINKIILHLEKKINNVDDLEKRFVNEQLKQAKYIKCLIEDDKDSEFYNKVIIHGVHKITPIMYLLFKTLESIGIEIIFLINYASNLPNTYRTWEEVYSWCDTKFEFTEELDLKSGKKLGVALSNILEGKNIDFDIDNKIIEYKNLTSFTDREVKPVFQNTWNIYNKTYSLNKMKKQYYAVSGESSNEILKMYFPEQFNQKPFLSYPIGQFILGIYNMWDFEENTIKLNEKDLNECAVSNVFKKDNNINILDIINKTKLYFSNIEKIDDYYKRIELLKKSLQIISSNNRYSSLAKISFFNLIYNELDKLKEFLEFIEIISNKIFKDTNDDIDFVKHFKTLIEIINVPTIKGNMLTQTEKSLIDEINSKLEFENNNITNKIRGNIKDVKDALAFFISGNIKGDTSNWIVRDFEQIDGAVLLRKKSKARKYHFALLSNYNMLKSKKDVLPWPLTENMFMGYSEANSAISIVTKCLIERRNFLQFILFYGVFFSKCDVELSYISEENGEEQRKYYLFDILNIKPDCFKEKDNFKYNEEDSEYIKEIKSFSTQRLTEETKELFSICPYKYFQKEVLKSDIEYYSEYHIKYYVSNFMYCLIKGIYDLNNKNISNNISEEFNRIKEMFPFWNEAIFLDIERYTREQINRYNKKYNPNVNEETIYERRKENFLIAQWKDYNTNKKCMDFNKGNIDEKINSYMFSSRIYPYVNELPHKKVCENCNFREVCLRDYYNAYIELEGEN